MEQSRDLHRGRRNSGVTARKIEEGDGRSGSRAVLRTLLLPPQIRVRSTPNSRHDSVGPEHLRLVPLRDLRRD